MNNSRRNKFDLLAVLLILCIFSAAVLSLLLSGAGTYKNMTEKDRISQERQIEELFLSNKVFQAENGDRISVSLESGAQVLSVESEENGEARITRVWFYDGWIRELYSDADYNFRPDDGEKIAKADSMGFEKEDGLLTVRLVYGGKEDTRYFDLRGGER